MVTALLTSIGNPLLDMVCLVIFGLAKGLLTAVWPGIETQVIAALVDTRREELGDTSTLGSRMRNQYRLVCELAMKEMWTKEQFIESIKNTTNEMIKTEIEKEENGTWWWLGVGGSGGEGVLCECFVNVCVSPMLFAFSWWCVQASLAWTSWTKKQFGMSYLTKRKKERGTVCHPKYNN